MISLRQSSQTYWALVLQSEDSETTLKTYTLVLVRANTQHGSAFTSAQSYPTASSSSAQGEMRSLGFHIKSGPTSESLQGRRTLRHLAVFMYSELRHRKSAWQVRGQATSGLCLVGLQRIVSVRFFSPTARIFSLKFSYVYSHCTFFYQEVNTKLVVFQIGGKHRFT